MSKRYPVKNLDYLFTYLQLISLAKCIYAAIFRVGEEVETVVRKEAYHVSAASETTLLM